MRLAWKIAAFPLVTGLVAGGCGSSTEPGQTNFTAAEQAALANALASSGVLSSNPLAAFAGVVVGTIDHVGTMSPATSAAVTQAVDNAIRLSAVGAEGSSYSAVGLQISFTSDIGGQSTTGWFIGAVGWNGLNTQTNSVSELMIVGGSGDGATPPSSASGTIEDGDLTATYWNGTRYEGTSGTGTVTASNFSGGGTDCSTTVQGITVTCSLQRGNMAGNVGFEAAEVGGTQTFTQPTVQFSSLPTVKLTINVAGG
jgi:hypothetical protein